MEVTLAAALAFAGWEVLSFSRVWHPEEMDSAGGFRWVSEDLQKTARNGRGRLAAVSVEILANPAIFGVKQ